MEDLPTSFDVIVLGTGMPESILAAAAARSGKSVLHLDQNDFYGGDWASFNFDQLNCWIKRVNENNTNVLTSTESVYHLAQEGEKIVALLPRNSSVFNVNIHEYIDQCNNDTGQTEHTEHLTEKANVPSESEIDATLNTSESEQTTDTTAKDELKQEPEAIKEQVPKPREELNKEVATVPPKQITSPKWTIEEFHKQRRKFNLDLAPKLMFSKGALVELLIQSNISRYAEFKCSSQILTLMDNHLMPVPCSRADVFSTPHVSIVEKRMLMKLLKFCLEFENHPEEYQEYENKPFIKFLNSKKLTKNVEHYIIHSIAMVDPNSSTIDSLKRVQKFLQSLGRYGNSPFLFPLYGSGEMPQCFCRLCAVFGGIYCLKQSIDALVLRENICVAAIVNNKRIDCKFVVMESGYASKAFLPAEYSTKRVSKVILITDSPIYQSDNDQLTFLRIPEGDNINSAISVLELGPSSNIAPPGLRVIHMSCISKCESSEADLLPTARLLLNFAKEGTREVKIEDKKLPSKPTVLWAMFYNQFDNSWLDLNEKVPDNLFVVPTPDIEQDYEIAIDKAKSVFLKIFPNEDFLPRAPEPEEIIMDGDEIKSSENGPTDTESAKANLHPELNGCGDSVEERENTETGLGEKIDGEQQKSEKEVCDSINMEPILPSRNEGQSQV